MYDPNKVVICIDPGHGGRDSGAVGPLGTEEKTINLRVALKLEELLYSYFSTDQVVLTRITDTFVALRTRAAISNDWNASIFISIHCNAAGGHGHEVFTSPGTTKADALATSCFNAYSDAFPMLPKRTHYADGDPDKEARFTVLTKTRAAAILYELEFIDTTRGEEFLTNEKNQTRMAKALAAGIVAYIEKMPVPTPQEPPLELPPGLVTLNEVDKGLSEISTLVQSLQKRLAVPLKED